MHVAVIGAGVCTAYYLNEAGCDVTVLERSNRVAQEASFALSKEYGMPHQGLSPAECRIAGTAELGSPTLSLEMPAAQGALRTLVMVARDWFPGAANDHSATWWTGARPMLPDGPPVLGATPHPRVFVNFGHGSTGWAMAAGSGKIVADVLMQRTTDIDHEGLTLARYGRN